MLRQNGLQPVRLWAFVTVTNNDTQHVTAVSRNSPLFVIPLPAFGGQRILRVESARSVRRRHAVASDGIIGARRGVARSVPLARNWRGDMP